MDGNCFCCNEIIKFENFWEAGHIVSKKNNGPFEIDNLICLCRTCNGRMSFTNLKDWLIQKLNENKTKYKYGEINYNKFISEKYGQLSV